MNSFSILTKYLDSKSMDKKISIEGVKALSKSKSQEEREWAIRKQDQQPHGKVQSFKQLAKETEQEK